MKFAYADPPYLGQGIRHYSKQHPEAGAWDRLETHANLIADLERDYPDGWAMSASSPSLRQLLPLCPERSRVACWVKPFGVFKPGVNPAYVWEPVIFAGGRRGDRQRPTVRDWHAANITLQKGLSGAKPESFCNWILDLLGWESGDEFDDLFPGTGVMAQTIAARMACAAYPSHVFQDEAMQEAERPCSKCGRIKAKVLYEL